MSNKFKDIDIKSHSYYFFDDIINLKNLLQIKLKWMKIHTKIFLFTTLLHDNQRFEILKN